MAKFKTIEDLGDLRGRRVLVRGDLNVPLRDGRVGDATRLAAIRRLMERAATEKPRIADQLISSRSPKKPWPNWMIRAG